MECVSTVWVHPACSWTTTTTTMSTRTDTDDILASLTASFNRNHISQEAVDIDVLQVFFRASNQPPHSPLLTPILQAQLREALAHATSSPRTSQQQHPNTPTQSILSQNFAAPDNTNATNRKLPRPHRHSRSKASSFSVSPDTEDLMMIEEDELEVEHLLDHQASSSMHYFNNHNHHHSPYTNHHQHQQQHSTMSPSNSYASTDPFYANSVQSHQSRQYMAPQSAFFTQQ